MIQTPCLPIQRMLAVLVLCATLPAHAAFNDNGDGTVTDTATNLVWDRCAWGSSGAACTGVSIALTWNQALVHAVSANSANYKNHNDWRLPNRNELETLVDLSRANPAIDSTAFPNTEVNGFWSSTSLAPDPTSAWYVYAYDGQVLYASKAQASYVRLVRGGQPLTMVDGLPEVADVTITNTVSAATVVAGSTVGYTIAVGNNGPAVASGVTWNDTLPMGAVFVSLPAVTGWTCTTPAAGASGTVTCSKASLSVSETTVFSLTIAVGGTIAGGVVLSNTATVAASATDLVPANNSATASVGVTAAIALVVVPPTTTTTTTEPTIPTLPVSVAIPGISALPAVANMAAGEGPSFMADLVRILSNTLSTPLQYVEQNAVGSVVLSGFRGGNLTFVPSNFLSGGDARANGVYAMGDGRYQVVRGGQSLVVAPVVVRLDQLTALLPNLQASVADNGVITATINGLIYAVQPGVAVQLDKPSGSAQLSLGIHGLWHFIDALGNNQILYPAFADTGALRSSVLSLDPGAALNIELDATAAILFKGQPYTLAADLTLISTPAERVGQLWWQEKADHYGVVNGQPSGTAQGLTVKTP